MIRRLCICIPFVFLVQPVAAESPLPQTIAEKTNYRATSPHADVVHFARISSSNRRGQKCRSSAKAAKNGSCRF